MAKKKILIICSSFPPEKGAAANRMYHLAQLLKQQQYEPLIYTPIPNYPTGKFFEGYSKNKNRFEEIDGLNVHRYWFWPSNSSNILKRLWSHLSLAYSLYFNAKKFIHQQKPDVVIVSSPPLITGYITSIITRKLKLPLLLNISDLWPQSAVDLNFLKEGLLYRFLHYLEQRMYENATAISVQSEYIEQYIAAKVQKPIFLYRNLNPVIKTIHFNNEQNAKRKIVYAGLLGVAQGLLNIIKNINFKALNTELHIYGQGYELPYILDYVQQHSEEKGVYYKGVVETNDVPIMLMDYQAMLIPLSTTIHGAVPSKIFNALANHIPILFSGNGEGASIVERYGIGWSSNVQDYKALEQNIKTLIALDQEKYKSLKAQCKKVSEEVFNKEQQDKKFYTFFEQNLS